MARLNASVQSLQEEDERKAREIYELNEKLVESQQFVDAAEKQLELQDKQIKEKDEQIRVKEEQIKEKDDLNGKVGIEIDLAVV